MKDSNSLGKRANSMNVIKKGKYTPLASLAEKNLVSLREHQERLFTNRPLRIILPDYFNIPKFNDRSIDFSMNFTSSNSQQGAFQSYREKKGLKKKLKDLSILSEGMKRAKNIKQESRYYFIQGVILHNSGMWQKSIEMFQKFLKIVLFIKDEKSIELALNSIAICYMYLNRPQQALQYHQKQTFLNENTEYFIGRVNIGLCKQMIGKKSEAHQLYCELYEILINISQIRQQFLRSLIERTKDQTNHHYLLTENISKGQAKSNFIPQQLAKQNVPQENSIYVGTREKLMLQEGKQKKNPQQMNHSYSTKKYNSIKVNYAIFSAESGINTYLQDMKNSFQKQN